MLDAAYIAQAAREWVPLLATLGVCIVGLLGARFLLLGKRGGARKEVAWTRQLSYFALVLSAVVAVILALPLPSQAQGQLLSLLGLLLTAAIALSSTTFVGNAMAGFMLSSLKNFQPGDFVRVGDAFGRVTVRGLLHTEIQTEDRDLTTLPNLTLVTTPVTVIHSTGTLVSAEVSLGYDVSWQDVERQLLAAAKSAELNEAFVQVRALGDFSILYRVSGFLAEVKYLVTARSRLRSAMLDALHRAHIEIVSPTFMNQRAIGQEAVAARPTYRMPTPRTNKAPEDVMFDKAEQAQTQQQLKERLEELGDIKKALEQDKSGERRAEVELNLVNREIERLTRLIDSDD